MCSGWSASLFCSSSTSATSAIRRCWLMSGASRGMGASWLRSDRMLASASSGQGPFTFCMKIGASRPKNLTNLTRYCASEEAMLPRC